MSIWTFAPVGYDADIEILESSESQVKQGYNGAVRASSLTIDGESVEAAPGRKARRNLTAGQRIALDAIIGNPDTFGAMLDSGSFTLPDSRQGRPEKTGTSLVAMRAAQLAAAAAPVEDGATSAPVEDGATSAPVKSTK